jgi:hypothetical protein
MDCICQRRKNKERKKERRERPKEKRTYLEAAGTTPRSVDDGGRMRKRETFHVCCLQCTTRACETEVKCEKRNDMYVAHKRRDRNETVTALQLNITCHFLQWLFLRRHYKIDYHVKLVNNRL